MRLSSIKNSNNIYSILDFSRIITLVNSINLNLNNSEHRSTIDFITQKIMEYISPEVSGVVVDSEFDFKNIMRKSNSTGLLMSLEKKVDELDPLILPVMANNWGVEQIRNNYAVAKLELYYNPTEPEAMKKKQFVTEVYDFCKYEGIDLLLELMVYYTNHQSVTKETMLETQLQAIEEFSRSCDLLGLEFLGDSLSAVTITAAIDIPWIYNARNIGYEEFKQNLRICIESGAKGFMAGDPIWFGENTRNIFANYENKQEIENHIKTNIRDRVIEVTRIASEY